MNDKAINVLLIEDNPGDTRLIREMLAEVRGARFDLEHTDRLSTGLERLAAGGIDVVLLDLALPDSLGFDTFIKMHAQAAEAPIIVLTGLDDEVLAVKAVREGALDYLVKGQVDGNLLGRAMHYAIERQRAEKALKEYSERLEEMLEERTQELRDAQEQLIRRMITNSRIHRIRFGQSPRPVLSPSKYSLSYTPLGEGLRPSPPTIASSLRS